MSLREKFWALLDDAKWLLRRLLDIVTNAYVLVPMLGAASVVGGGLITNLDGKGFLLGAAAGGAGMAMAIGLLAALIGLDHWLDD